MNKDFICEGRAYRWVTYTPRKPYARYRFSRRERKWMRDKSHYQRRMRWARTTTPRRWRTVVVTTRGPAYGFLVLMDDIIESNKPLPPVAPP